MKTSSIKATSLVSLGAALEYYDFIIYGMMASLLGGLFFPDVEGWLATFKAFSVFAVGYLARPIGGILFGTYADIYGRKRSFIAVMYVMALSTFAIGLLPTYSQIGQISGLLLIMFRILQGISFGAELPGAITVICEYANKRSHGTHSGFLISSVTLGSLLASLVLFILTFSIDEKAVNSWGWRVPFLLGGILALVNGVIRSQLDETPEFLNRKKTPEVVPVVKLWRESKATLLLGIGMTLLLSSLIIFVIYLPAYLKEFFGYDSSSIYLSITVGLVWAVFCLPLCGWLADHFDKRLLFILTSLIFVIAVNLMPTLLSKGTFWALLLVLILIQTIISFLTVSYFPLIASMFGVNVRYTGIALCYNIAYSLMGGLPLLLTYAISRTGNPVAAIFILQGIALIAALSSFGLKALEKPART